MRGLLRMKALFLKRNSGLCGLGGAPNKFWSLASVSFLHPTSDNYHAPLFDRQFTFEPGRTRRLT
jgi:hypothetical protein